jgi:hypothetical protein
MTTRPQRRSCLPSYNSICTRGKEKRKRGEVGSAKACITNGLTPCCIIYGRFISETGVWKTGNWNDTLCTGAYNFFEFKYGVIQNEAYTFIRYNRVYSGAGQRITRGPPRTPCTLSYCSPLVPPTMTLLWLHCLLYSVWRQIPGGRLAWWSGGNMPSLPGSCYLH